MKFTENSLEESIINLFQEIGIQHLNGERIEREKSEIIFKDDLTDFLKNEYKSNNISQNEIDTIIRLLEGKPSSDLFETNKFVLNLISEGYLLKRDNRNSKDFLINLINFSDPKKNNYKIVNQLEILGYQKRIPDCILYINGLPLVVFEFKSAIKENCTIHDAYIQLTQRYRRDIPDLFKYNAFCVISDGVNNKVGNIFSNYEFFYSWRKITGEEHEDTQGIDTLFSLIKGAFEKNRLSEIIEDFIYFQDTSKEETKVLCRYPQFYAAKKLFKNILLNKKPTGSGKGGTYFGATGCGKSFTMLFLSRLLMKSLDFSSPTIVLITDRTDLDDQLSELFVNSKKFLRDENVISVKNRVELRNLLKQRKSGGVFLTTIQKFNEDLSLLSDRQNIICISDEAHRTQVNLDQNIQITTEGLEKKYGFAKHLHNSLPNATYVGFTGTPIDKTIDVFGEVVDAYTMKESVNDQITVKIVYEGRAAKVLLNPEKIQEIENYYDQCAEDGASQYAIDESKKSTTKMQMILGDPSRLKLLANDFINHYEKRCNEKSSDANKTIFVCSSRKIAFDFYKEIISLRPNWTEIKKADNFENLSKKDQIEILPIEKIKMVMTRDKDDPEKLWNLLGDKNYRKTLDKQFKIPQSNFKIAIVVDMWLTGFDVPSLDSIYIDKPIKRHNLIQAISRVNRNYKEKSKGLVVDYIGIKKQMNLALAHYSKTDQKNIEEINESILIVKNNLNILDTIFAKFDSSLYFEGTSLQKLNCLKHASEYIQKTSEIEKNFMKIVKEVKLAYEICSGSEKINQLERDKIYFYISIRSIIFKLTKHNAPDTAQMNYKVKEMISEAISSDGIQELFKIGEDNSELELLDEDHYETISKIKLPNTKFKLLQLLISRKIELLKSVNKVKSVNFSKKLHSLVEKYNDRNEQDVLRSEIINEFSNKIVDLYEELQNENISISKKGINFEANAFFDILFSISKKYQFHYPESKMKDLSNEIRKIVIEKAKYTDWLNRNDIKAELKADLIVLLSKFDYPPIAHDDAYKEIFEQAVHFKHLTNIEGSVN